MFSNPLDEKPAKVPSNLIAQQIGSDVVLGIGRRVLLQPEAAQPRRDVRASAPRLRRYPRDPRPRLWSAI